MSATAVGAPGEAGAAGVDAFDVRRATGARGLLGSFNDAGVLGTADVHVASRLGELCGETDEAAVLAVALAVRATRLGHVCVDLATVRHTATSEFDTGAPLEGLAWPRLEPVPELVAPATNSAPSSPGGWAQRVGRSRLVAVGDAGAPERPVRLVGTLVYLDRYWRDECAVAADLAARSESPAPGVDRTVLAGGLDRLFPKPAPAPDLQRLAAATAVLRRLAVVAGGPGTGKTTTVARILALLHEQAGAAGAPPPLVALAAPTGKAAARLEEAVRSEARALDTAGDVRRRVATAGAATLHRLLGFRPGAHSRFHHHRGNRLPHDVVIVDETSMVSLSLMARLLEAVRPTARLVLVGDPEQLASVEAGAVLGDVVGPARSRLAMRAPAADALAAVGGHDPGADEAPAGVSIGDGIVVLRRVHRFAGGIAALADAVRAGDADAAVAVATEGRHDVVFDTGSDEGGAGTRGGAPPAPPESVRDMAVAAGRRVVVAARAGDARGALAGLGAFRVLCAHRRGPYGSTTWMARVERWLVEAEAGGAGAGTTSAGAGDEWYPGRPLLVTQNDHALRLYNGDTGVVVAGAGGRPVAVFDRGGELVELSPTRLESVETVHAMTIHKAQGSQFDEVAVVLPDPSSPILTRELLYTAVTRARRRVVLAGTEEALRAAVTRPVARASGLRRRLWHPPAGEPSADAGGGT